MYTRSMFIKSNLRIVVATPGHELLVKNSTVYSINKHKTRAQVSSMDRAFVKHCQPIKKHRKCMNYEDVSKLSGYLK